MSSTIEKVIGLVVVIVIIVCCGLSIYAYEYGIPNPLTSLEEAVGSLIPNALKDPGTPLICPATMDDNKAGLCYDKCATGYTSDGASICYENCPANWTGTSNLAYCQKKSTYSPGKAINLTCPQGQTRFENLCYDIPSGYKMVTAGRATAPCPINPNNPPTLQRDDGTSCWIDAKATPRTTPVTDGTVPGLQCPQGLTGFEGLCYNVPAGYSMASAGRATAPCPDGTTRDDGTTCWIDAKVWTNCGKFSGKSCPSGYVKGAKCTCTRKVQTSPKPTAWVTSSMMVQACPSGKTNYEGLCYTVPSGYTMSSPGVASKGCPAGQRADPTSCWIDAKATPKDTKWLLGQSLKPSCDAGYNLNDLKSYCYQNCSDNFQRQTSNLEFCTSICPSDMTDIGVSCQKKSSTRSSHALTAVGVCPTGKTKSHDLCIKNT